MQTNRRWLNLDSLKLTVAIILVILLLLMPRGATPAGLTAADAAARSTPNVLVQPEVPQELRASLPAGYQLLYTAGGEWQIIGSDGRTLYRWDENLKQWNSAQGGAVEPAATALPALAATTAPAQPTAAQPPASTATPPPSATQPPAAPTLAPTGTTAPTLSATAAPTRVPPPVGQATRTTTAAGCSPAAPARLEVGKSARVASNLNLRKNPGIEDNLIRVSMAGTTLKVVGGPQCVPYGSGAYRWWQVEAPDGTQGWSAEATLDGGLYFMEPLP